MTTFGPTVIQHVAATGSADVMGDAAPTFTDRPVVALAEFPGNSVETDNAATDTTLADLVLLFRPAVTVASADEFTATDGLRYKVAGKPGHYRNPMTGTAVTQVNLRRIS